MPASLQKEAQVLISVYQSRGFQVIASQVIAMKSSMYEYISIVLGFFC